MGAFNRHPAFELDPEEENSQAKHLKSITMFRTLPGRKRRKHTAKSLATEIYSPTRVLLGVLGRPLEMRTKEEVCSYNGERGLLLGSNYGWALYALLGPLGYRCW